MMWHCKQEEPINVVSIFVGFFFVLIGCLLVFQNENMNVKQIKKADEASKVFVSVDPYDVSEENEDKLITFVGDLSFSEPYLMDPEFGVSVSNTTYLRREVEVCQYGTVEKKGFLFKKTTETDKVWTKVEDSYLKDEVPYETKTFYATDVKIGNYSLDEDEMAKLTNEDVVKIPSNKTFKGNYTVYHNYIMSGDSMENPKIGDIRIRYYYNVNSVVSVFASQHNGGIREYKTKEGESIHYILGGRMEGDTFVNMIRYELNDRIFFTRAICFLLNALGFILIVTPIYKSYSNLKIFGKLVGKSVQIAGASLGVAISLFLVALAWLFYKPLFSLLFIAIVIVILLFIVSMFFQETDPWWTFCRKVRTFFKR